MLIYMDKLGISSVYPIYKPTHESPQRTNNQMPDNKVRHIPYKLMLSNFRRKTIIETLKDMKKSYHEKK